MADSWLEAINDGKLIGCVLVDFERLSIWSTIKFYLKIVVLQV